MTRAVAYVRVSTDAQSLSVEAQAEKIRLWCERYGYELVSTHVDEAVSGTVAPEQREALIAAIGDVVEHRAELVVHRRDRLSRDRHHVSTIELLLRKHKRRVFSSDREPYAEDDAEARVAEGVADLVAEYERAIIARRTKRALKAKRDRGEPVGNPPYGFEWSPEQKGVLRQSKSEQATIALAQRLRREGLSYAAVARELEARGHKPRSGRSWGRALVRKIAGESKR